MQFQNFCVDYNKCTCTKIPDAIKTQKDICELTQKTRDCEKFEKKDPENSWKYIRCGYTDMCFQRVVHIEDSVISCLVGLTATPVDLAKLAAQGIKLAAGSVIDAAAKAKLAAQIVSGAPARISKTNEWVSNCNKSIECKSILAKSNPSTKYLAEPKNLDDLKKTSASYLFAKKTEYDPVRVQMVLNGGISKEQYYKEMGWTPPAEAKLENLPPTEIVNLLAIWETIKSKIDSEINQVACYIPIEKQRLKCQILSDVLSGVAVEKAIAKNATASLTKKVLVETAEESERRVRQNLFRIANSSAPKGALVKEYAQKSITTKAENESWLKFIEKPSANQKNLTIENAKLKLLNDKIINDEEYVTSLMNLYGDMQLKEIKLLQEKLKLIKPNFEFKIGSDFKSIRVAYDDIPGLQIDGKKIEQLLKEAAEKTNKDFADYTLKNKLLRAEDQPAAWYKAALDKTDDLTGLKAKFTRENAPEGKMFLDAAKEAEFKTWAQNELSSAQKLRSEVLGIFKETSDVTSKNLPEANLQTGVFGILRKYKDKPDLAKSMIEQKYGISPLSSSSFDKLQDYFKKADVMSPGLRSTERLYATLADAPHGGISIDMIDLGADHIQATSAQAFAKSKNINEFLIEARAGEQALTQKILERKIEIEKKFREITGDPNAKVLCSGDGCKAYLTNRELTEAETKAFVDAVTAGGEQGKLRFSEIKNLQSREFIDAVTKQGENLEKSLRLQLNGIISPKSLDGVNFTVVIKATQPGEGTAKLIISPANGFKLSPQESKKIEEAFSKALRESKMGYK